MTPNVPAYWDSGGFEALSGGRQTFTLLFQAGAVPPLSQYAR